MMPLGQALALLRRANEEIARAEAVYETTALRRPYEQPYDPCVATTDGRGFYLHWLEGENGRDDELYVMDAGSPAEWDDQTFEWKQAALNPSGSWKRRTVTGFHSDGREIFGVLDCGHWHFDGRPDYRLGPLQVGQQCVCADCQRHGTGYFEETGISRHELVAAP